MIHITQGEENSINPRESARLNAADREPLPARGKQMFAIRATTAWRHAKPKENETDALTRRADFNQIKSGPEGLLFIRRLPRGRD